MWRLGNFSNDNSLEYLWSLRVLVSRDTAILLKAKETVIPTIVRISIPTHEVHRNEAKHYTITNLQRITVKKFKQQGGNVTGWEEQKDRFERNRNQQGTV